MKARPAPSDDTVSRLNRLLSKVMAGLNPPEDLTVSQWAEKYRVLSPESSAERGRWRNSRTRYLVDVMDAFTDPKVKHIVMVAASQVGKALAVDTPIPTPGGWTTMGEIQEGDTVFDDQGYPCQVTFATEVMTGHKCYRVTFSDGAQIVADADHRWSVEWNGPKGTWKHSKAEIFTTEEIFRTQHFYDATGRKHNTYAIPVSGGLKLPEEELPIPPYTLGAWLGDGNSYSAQLTTAKEDIEILDNIRAEGLTLEVREKVPGILNSMINPKTAVKDMRFCIRGHDMDKVGRTPEGYCAECHRQFALYSMYGRPVDPVINKQETGHSLLLGAGVLKNKHIPLAYLRASYDQRMALLQGLMDTDGTVTDKGRCSIVLKSKQLIDGVSELLHSLGIKHTLKVKKARCTNSKNSNYECDVYRIDFLVYSDTPVFRLKRKLARMVDQEGKGPNGRPRRTSETFRRRITEVEEVESVPVRCIQVDSPSHLYLAGPAMIPTHNTEAELNIVGYIIHQDPGSILFIHPTMVDAKEFSKLRVGPMLRDCPVLRKQTGTPKTTDSYNSVLQKTYPGGILTLTGSTEAHALASKPIRYVLGDERDRWAASAGTEGDPWSLAMARQKTFYNAKAVEVSTPTIKGSSAIEKSYARGTMERWKTKCPHCGQYHEIQWKDIRFEYEENVVQNEVTYNVTSVEYLCPSCGCLSDEMTMKRQPARWEADNPSALDNGIRSFWLNAFVSQWESWKDIVLQFLDAKGDSKKLQVVFNTCFGMLWENRGDMETEEGVMARREDYGTREDGSPIELPDGVLVVTAGVDTQDDRMEYELVGHGYFGETWGLEKGIIMGRPDSDEVWDALDKIVFTRQLHFADGIPLRVARSFVDEGGHFTQEIRQRCRDRQHLNVFACKGMSGSDRPYTAPPKKQKIVIRQRYIGECWQYQIGVDAGKQIIMDNLKVKTPGPRYCHFPRRDDYGPAYFNGLMSEHLVYDPNKKQPWHWEKLPGHERNEPLDVRNYANAAYKTLAVNLDMVVASLRRMRGQKAPPPPTPPRIQPAEHDKPDQTAPPPPPPPQPRQQPRQKSRRRVGTHKYFDEW